MQVIRIKLSPELRKELEEIKEEDRRKCEELRKIMSEMKSVLLYNYFGYSRIVLTPYPKLFEKLLRSCIEQNPYCSDTDFFDFLREINFPFVVLPEVDEVDTSVYF